MSKAARQSIFILIGLLIIVFAFAAVTYLQKQQAETAKISLQKQIEDYQKRETEHILEAKDLQEKLKATEQAKAELEQRLSRVDVDIDSIDATMKKLTEERDQWKKKVDALAEEKDKLAAELEAKEKEGPKIVYKYVEKEPAEEEASAETEEEKPAQKAEVPVQDDSYWAQVLKEKAALEMQLENLKKNMTDNSVEIVELKKKNSDLQLALSDVQNEKESIEREIKYGNDLADTLALELARAKNDRKFLNDRMTKLGDENGNLREQIKGLTSTKIALEKTIVRLQDEKRGIEKKLLETENVIQSRIDEIWEIKESLNKGTPPPRLSQSVGEIELPPIVVAQGDRAQVSLPAPKTPGVGVNGNILSVNEENNFVILDLGEASGVQVGEKLNVYRGAEYVAGLEIIQVRKDICAADIKDRVAKIKVGDAVK